MKKIFFLTIIVIHFLSISKIVAQQDYSNKFDFKFGTGIGFMGWGDLLAVCFENELNYKINDYFTTSVGLGYGRNIGNGNYVFEQHNDYLLGSLNGFISPFRNNRRNNFRIGGGYTYLNQATSYIAAIYHFPYEDIRYVKDSYSAHCFNVIVEDEYRITTRLMIGAKLFYTGDIKDGGSGELFGGLIKFGVAL